MLERFTIEVPAQFREAMRAERYEKRTTYRSIVLQMLENRYGPSAANKQNRKKKEGSPAGA